MILNSRASNFYFVFPKGFFPASVVEKYTPYIKQAQTPYDTLTQFMNSTIQSINFPGMALSQSSQTKYLGKKVSYKGSTPVQDMFNQEFTVTFRMGDGFINYWIMLDTVLHFENFLNSQVYIEDLPLRFLDNQGNILVTNTFKQIIMTSISEVQLNYTQNNPQVSTFSVGFKSNFMDIKLHTDQKLLG
jgi:hypothetical protein